MQKFNDLFNLELARQFNLKYLRGHEFVFKAYQQKDHTDLWTKIKSSMDWIETAIFGLNKIKPDILKLKKYSGLQVSTILFNLISNISMLVNAINSLWDALLAGSDPNYSSFSRNKRDVYEPFHNNNSIFHGKVVKNSFTHYDLIHHNIYRNVSDNKFFSTIRAFFGVHSTNGNPKIYI